MKKKYIEEYQSRKLTEAEENTYRGGLCRNCYRIIKRGGIYED